MKKLTFFILMCAIMCITSACNSGGETSSENPFFVEWDTPYGVPPFDKIKVQHYAPAFEMAIAQHQDEIAVITNNTSEPTFENTIEALDNSGHMLNDVANIFFMVAAADITPEMQAIQGDIASSLASHSDELYLNDVLFERVDKVYKSRESLGLDVQQMRLLEKTYRSFVRSGSLLTDVQKERVKAINQELTTVSIDFANNMLEDNKSFELVIENEEDLAGLPESVVASAASTAESLGKAGKWVFRLNKPSMLPFLTYSENAELRKQLYDGYLTRGNHDDEFDNKELIKQMVKLRTERASILGYDSHAAYVLDVNMAKTPENVYGMLDQIWAPALSRAKAELADMKKMKKEETGSDEFSSSDWWYYAEKVRKDKYDLDEEMLRPYFSLENVKAGIFDLSNRLYGITFRPVSVPIYNKECETYEVLDKDGSHLAVLYLDFFPRDSKGAGAWCGTFRDQRYVNGERVTPVVSIVCNFTRPSGNTPALLSLDETTTFFHEFGHALHNFFTDVRYSGIAGVERDFVELPSQIMENWAVEPQMLKRYALHYKTNEVMPEQLMKKISSSALFNQGFETVEYLAASYSDMDIHSMKSYKDFDVNAFETEALNGKRGLIDEIAPRYRYPYFSHIFDGGYSAGYYGYVWAEVLDKDAFAAFKESGDLFNPEIAASFRANVLSMGGIYDGGVLYRNFRGKDASIKPLMDARGL
ncbi:MAG: M3 family metallopeptidase [Rikenellaceae bacterium]